MMGIWALGAYLAVILLWTTLIKRSVGEAMILGFLVVLPFTGAAAAQIGWASLYSAVTDEIVYATMAFVFMGYLLDQTGVLDRLIDLLNSLIGGIKGGPAWVSTVASAGLGGVVHNQAAIAATVGSVTIPWMEKSRLDKPSARRSSPETPGWASPSRSARQCSSSSDQPPSGPCWTSTTSSCPCSSAGCGASCTG